MQYYIVSLKHTSKADTAITLWKSASAGYCWYQEWAGLYTHQEQMKHSPNDQHDVFIEKDLLESYLTEVMYEGGIWNVLPNTPEVRKALNLNYNLMKPKRNKTCNIIIKHKKN